MPAPSRAHSTCSRTASYAKFQDIEHSADEKYIAWVAKHAADPIQFEADMRRLIGDRPSPGYYHRLAWHGVYRVGPDGETCLGKWAKAGFPGLGADERILMRSWMRMSAGDARGASRSR